MYSAGEKVAEKLPNLWVRVIKVRTGFLQDAEKKKLFLNKQFD